MILPKVLLIEDDRSIAGALALALKTSYDVDVAGSGKLALEKTSALSYEVIVLDLSLPDASGITICQRLRDRGLRTPILILSGDSAVLTKINLLDAGANDYLTKPFSLGELKARLRVLLRTAARDSALNEKPVLGIYGITLDRQSFLVTRDNTEIHLRRKEFDILEYLLEHAGQVVSRDSLSRYIWQDREERWTNTVTVHIKSLRDKLYRPFKYNLIHTVHGRGYKLDAANAVSKLLKVG